MATYFAEYLPRLKTTSIQVELSRNQIENVEINNDSILINSSIEIKFPCSINSKEVTYTITPSTPSSSSIRIRNKNIEFLANDNVETFLQDQYQWNIGNLQKYQQQQRSFRCINCNCNIIEVDKVRRFLPMPSELWYEMLDFWHCHKPTAEDNVGLLKKFNQLKPNPYNLIIGSYYFIINPEDWPNLKVDGNDILSCEQCSEILGGLDIDVGTFKIYKWQLNLDGEFFHPYSYISLKLVEEMNYSALRVFKIVNEKNNKTIQVWCFGLGIDINIFGLGMFKNCLKIMYKTEFEEDNEISKQGEIMVEYEKPFNDFVNHIKKVNKALPTNLQNYKNWKTSYIAIS